MFFILSKALLFLINPLIWILVCLLGALFLKNPKWKRRCVITAISLTLFFSNPAIANWVVKQWEPTSIPIDEINTPYDIGIVLSGYALFGYDLPNEQDLFYYGNGANRLSQAVELYKLGKIKQLLLSGSAGNILGTKISESQETKKYLIRLGIPESAILVESASRNTYENAVYTTKKLQKMGRANEKIILLTSAIHLPRATKCFAKTGLKVTPFGLDYTASATSFSIPNLVPNASAFKAWQQLLKEWVGLAVYWIRGYV